MRAKGLSTRNELLYRLPADEAARVGAVVERVSLVVGEVVCEVGAPIRYALFPTLGIVSLLGVSGEGEALELALVGRGGMFGLPLVVGVAASPVRAVVQGAGSALRIKAAHLRHLIADCPTLRTRTLRFSHRLTTEIAQSAVCNCFHSIESRTARWMLSMSDRMQSNTFVLTQALLAVMLGVLRPTVNHAARKLSVRGIVSYSRGNVRILDRPSLESLACSCYSMSVEQSRPSLKT